MGHMTIHPLEIQMTLEDATERIHLRLQPSLKRAAEAQAQEEGRALSKLMREALLIYLIGYKRP